MQKRKRTQRIKIRITDDTGADASGAFVII